MDPLSVAASVAGLLSLTIQLVQISTSIAADAKAVQAYDFIIELNALGDVLKRLRVLLNDQSETGVSFTQVSVLVATNTRCEHKLKELLQKLQRTVLQTNRIKRALDSVLWPLSKKEHSETTSDIHRYTNLFHFALTIEGCSMLAKSSTEVAESLKVQAQKLEETKSLCSAIPDLVIQVGSSLAQISNLQAAIQMLVSKSAEVEDMSRGIAKIELNLDAQKANEERRQTEKERRLVLSWLSSLSFEAKQQHLRENRQQGTGGWLIESEEFRKWRFGPKGSTLWCSGIPGAGKTFMASLVVDTLREENNSICTAFVYADYTESFQQTALSFLSCITRQLTTQYPDFMKLATKRFKDQIKRYRLQEADWLNTPTLSFDECFKLLQDFSAYDTHVFIIVDAVDEIRGIDEKSSTDIRFKLFQALAKLKYVSLFCTCRPNISASFFFDLFAEIHIEASDADLRTFLEARVTASRRLSDFISKSRTLQEEIVGTITKKASGMFLLARLQLDQLVSAITVRQVRQMLDKLSSQLFDMYDHTLQRIKQQSHVEAKLGIRAISWVAHTKRPMTISEFVQALSIENGDRSLDSSGVIDISIILEACAGLLHLQPASSDLEINGPFQKEETVQFVHYTTQEYILENQPDQYLSSHCDIANTCLTYLCFESFKMGASRYDYKSNCACVFRQTHPFLAYAAVFWPLHASISTSSLRYDLIKVLISPRFPWLSRNWLQFALRGTFQNTYTNIPPGFAAAALAIHGADNILKLLVGDGPFFKCKFLSTWTPLKIAILYGHQSCVDIIVSHGLEDNLEANRSWALGFLMDCYESEKLRIFHNSSDSNIDAMKKADHNAYEIILSAAGDVTRTELRRMTVPLFSKAILMGDETLAQRMLEAGWNARLAYSAFEVSASRGIGAWQETIYKVTGRMLKMMIDAGVDTNLRLADYNSPLNLAIRQQNEQMVSDLLLYGATSVSSGELSNLPLELAILLRNLPIVNQLLIHGAIVRDPFEKKTDPLWLALREYRFSRYSYYTERARVEALIINQLIEISWGCVITRKEYTSILTHAVNAGQFEAAQELVARYYQDCQGNNYKFPDEVLPLLSKLLRYGLPFSSSFIEFWSACKPGGIDILTMANRYGNIRLLEQILGGELEVNIPKGFRSPLMMAIRYHQQTPQSITWMRDQDLTANTGLTRLALECIIPRSEEAYQIIQLLIELYRSNLGTRTWCPSPWFSTNALLSISRLTDSFGINILKKALIRGVRPVGLNYEVCLILEKFSCLGRNMPQHIQAKSALITSALDIPMWGVSNALRNLDTSVYGDKSYEIQPPSHAECVEMQEWLLAIGPMEPTCPSPESKLVRHISAPALSTLFKCKGASEAEMEGSSKMHQHEQVSGGCEESDCERLKTKDHNRILALQLSGVI